MISSIVLANGMLDEQKVMKIEHLYQGMNGRFVDRFYITPCESYIFKPLTNESQIGKELWVYNHVLIRLPSYYPRIFAHSIAPDNHWIIFEDLGVIDHHFSDKSVLDMAKLIAEWHKTPCDEFTDFPQKGPKPFIEEIVEELVIRKDEVKNVTNKHGIPLDTIESLFEQLRSVTFTHDKVLSHGDLHLGNYGYARGKLFVIDWEHVHLNSPYWDLYHLLDISHPVFPKRISKRLRNLALDTYLDEAGHSRIKEYFKQSYYLFSSTFSLWMLLLIQADLEGNQDKWSEVQLKLQLEETLSSFTQCTEELE